MWMRRGEKQKVEEVMKFQPLSMTLSSSQRRTEPAGAVAANSISIKLQFDPVKPCQLNIALHCKGLKPARGWSKDGKVIELVSSDPCCYKNVGLI